MKKGNTSNLKRRYNNSLEKQSLPTSGYQQQIKEVTGRYHNNPTAHKKDKGKETPNITRVQYIVPTPRVTQPTQTIGRSEEVGRNEGRRNPESHPSISSTAVKRLKRHDDEEVGRPDEERDSKTRSHEAVAFRTRSTSKKILNPIKVRPGVGVTPQNHQQRR